MRMLLKAAGVTALAFTLGSCATSKNWQATGGSRSDGVVRLSYEYTLFESPVTDEAHGQRVASERCAAWGYDLARPFGGQTRVCTDNGYDGCMNWRVTKEYQCTTLAASAP